MVTRNGTPSTRTSGGLAREGIAEQVVDRILQWIRDGKLLPGQKLLPERELALQFGVGRPSLREALRALAILNVVDIRQGDGIFVSQLLPHELLEPLTFYLSLSRQSLEQLFEARIVYESGITGIAARTLGSEGIRRLQECVELGESALAEPARFLEIDVTFHETIVTAARNPFLERTADAFHALTCASRATTITAPSIRAQSHEDHKAIFQALLYRDEDLAAAAMARHLRNVWNAYRNLGMTTALGATSTGHEMETTP